MSEVKSWGMYRLAVEANSNEGHDPESSAIRNIISTQQVSRVKNNVCINHEKIDSPKNHNGVSSMDVLFLTRCIMSPNEVDEARAWSDYSNITANINPISVRYMKKQSMFNNMLSKWKVFSSKVELHKKSRLMWTKLATYFSYNWCHVILVTSFHLL